MKENTINQWPKVILVIFIKAVAELGVIPYTHLFIVKYNQVT